jgi:hypothetical protein
MPHRQDADALLANAEGASLPHDGAIMNDPKFCRRCGSALTPGLQRCPACGGSIADDDAAGAMASQAGDPSGLLRWRVDVPLLTNRFIVNDVILGAGATTLIAGLLIGGIFAWSGGWTGLRAGLTFAGIMGVFILIVSVFTLGVVFGNRWPLEFVLNDDGVIMNNVSEKARTIHRMSWILAILTGRPLMAGPGLIAQSREVVGIAWDDVRTVTQHPALGVIGIRGGLLDNIRLYCTPANYAQVAQRVEAAVRQHAPSARIS